MLPSVTEYLTETQQRRVGNSGLDARFRGVVPCATTRLRRTTPERTRHAARACAGAAHVVKSARHARAPVHVTRTVAPTSLPT